MTTLQLPAVSFAIVLQAADPNPTVTTHRLCQAVSCPSILHTVGKAAGDPG